MKKGIKIGACVFATIAIVTSIVLVVILNNNNILKNNTDLEIKI